MPSVMGDITLLGDRQQEAGVLAWLTHRTPGGDSPRGSEGTRRYGRLTPFSSVLLLKVKSNLQ